MNLRISMLLAALVAGVAYGQAAAPSQAAAPGNGGGARAGSAPSRANGLPPTSPGLTGTSSSSQLNNANGINSGAANGGRPKSGNSGGASNSTGANNSGSNRQPPAPADTGNVEVTGRPAENRAGTVDHPLLPIVSFGNSLAIRSGTPIRVKLQAPLDSGHARNGDMVEASLAEPVANLRAGTPVRLTVVQSVSAGQLYSYGELSVQVVSIADHRVLSDTITAQGKEGAKELPDAAPARGTEAIFTPDQTISLPAS